MFRCFKPFLAKVPYATLFAYNPVLQSVFQAPADKVALRVEMPGKPEVDYTYGRLQRDVIELANVLAARNEEVAATKGEGSLSWVQPPRAANVRSVFAQGERVPSCDELKDTGFYSMSIMCGSGYAFPVAMLAGWALNQLTTPMSVAQHYDDELMYVLEHSGSRSILGETALLKEKFPKDYDSLYVRNNLNKNSHPTHSGNTFDVHTVVDLNDFFFTLERQSKDSSFIAEDAVECMEDEKAKPLNSAESIVDRIEKGKSDLASKKLQHIEGSMIKQHQNAHEYMAMTENTELLSFDTDKLDELNPVFRKWHDDPSSRPTKYDDCLMIYTSGTTARPKGAVHSHASVTNMVRVLQDAWEWTSDDSILHVLPVHHLHGLVNVLFCSLASNARCVCTKFDDPARVAHRLERGDISVFMAVPTIYTKLISAIQRQFSPIEKTGFKKGCSSRVRLMVCGSAALPVPTLEQFKELSGHTLLERYGMTELGIALGQVLRPVGDRIPGTVGSPLPTVETCVYTPKDSEAQEENESKANESGYDEVGSLAIASESLFDRYWRNPTATKKEMYVDGAGKRYFETGDTVGVKHVAGKPSNYTILGRSSVDIIKSRGYKLSALEIEAALLSRKDLFYEMAVVGSKDQVQGEKVVAIVALQPEAAKKFGVNFDGKTVYEDAELTEQMKKVALDVLAPYKCPGRYLFVPEIPRNPTGKVNKKSLKSLLNL